MMYETKYGEVLQHHGVKGMKWGVRKKDDYKATINSMSRAGRARNTLDIYKGKQKRLAEKGKTDPTMNRFINHQTKVSEKYSKEAYNMVQKYIKTHGKESLTPKITRNMAHNPMTGKTIVADPKLSTAVGVQKYVVAPIVATGITMAGIMAFGNTPRMATKAGMTAGAGISLTSESRIKNSRARRDYRNYKYQRYN